MRTKVWIRAGQAAVVGLGVLVAMGCDASAVPARQVSERVQVSRPAHALSDSEFAALVDRVSEPGGYFDTDNLISNERGYLKVLGAMDRLGVTGGAYVGVGPDQNFSYIAQVEPVVAFITDIRRDNLLHHLLLKALIERAPTRVEFLAGLQGREPPESAAEWRARSISEVVDYVDQADPAGDIEALRMEVTEAVVSYGVPLSAEDTGEPRARTTRRTGNSPSRPTSMGTRRPIWPRRKRTLRCGSCTWRTESSPWWATWPGRMG
jgi:hypothetical protein